MSHEARKREQLMVEGNAGLHQENVWRGSRSKFGVVESDRKRIWGGKQKRKARSTAHEETEDL